MEGYSVSGSIPALGAGDRGSNPLALIFDIIPLV